MTGEQSDFAVGAAIPAEVLMLLGAPLGSSRFLFRHILNSLAVIELAWTLCTEATG